MIVDGVQGNIFGFSGLTKLVGMFVSRVTHQLFQVIDPVSQCSMMLKGALEELLRDMKIWAR